MKLEETITLAFEKAKENLKAKGLPAGCENIGDYFRDIVIEEMTKVQPTIKMTALNVDFKEFEISGISSISEGKYCDYLNVNFSENPIGKDFLGSDCDILKTDITKIEIEF